MNENFNDAPGRWLATMYSAGAVLVALVGRFSPSMLILGLLGVALFAPPLQRMAKRHWNLPAVKGLLVLPLFIALAVAIPNASSYEEKAAARAAAEAQQQAAAAARRAEQQHFAANKPAILAQIVQLGKEQKFDEANALTGRFLKVVKDADLQLAAEETRKSGHLWRLKHGPAMSDRQKALAYAELAKLAPGNPGYAKQAERFAGLVRDEEERIADEQARIARQQAREKMLEKQFSAWDGSHLKVAAQVKQTMKNPDSYEHVETRYIDTGNGMRITTTFRGTNSFGGVVPNTVVATVDDDGNVLSIRSL